MVSPSGTLRGRVRTTPVQAPCQRVDTCVRCADGRAMKLRTSLSALVVVCAALALPAAASAEGGNAVVGFQVVSGNPADGTVTGILHCVPPQVAGRQVTLPAPADVVALAPNTVVGVHIVNGQITEQTGPPPCDAPVAPLPPQGQPKQPEHPGGDLPAGVQRPHGPGDAGPKGGGDDLPRFLPAFTNRIWRFTGEANGF